MSSKKGKKNDTTLLIPGPHGWEIWEDGGSEGARLKVRTDVLRALDVEGLPSRDLRMAFPVREVSALPLKAPTTDASLFADLAEMHIERLGMRPPVEMGNLSDYFPVSVRSEDSLLLPVVLTPPPEGTMPKKSPAGFDVSARCFELPGDAVVIWRELGRWAFAIGVEGRPLYFQAIASPILGEAAGKEISMSLAQLEIQGLLERRPARCFVWLVEEEVGPSAEQLAELRSGFGGPASTATKPAPIFPPKPSGLLPADTRAERVAKRKKQQTQLAVAAMVLAYLGLAGWFGWQLYDLRKKAAVVKAAAEELQAGAGGVFEHSRKWAELEPITATEHWPVELLFRCAQAIPDTAPDAPAGVRFERAEFNNQLEVKDQGATTLVRSIRLQGEAQELEQVNQFNLNLKRSDDLAAYEWTTPAASETNSGAWSFFYDAVYKGGGTY